MYIYFDTCACVYQLGVTHHLPLPMSIPVCPFVISTVFIQFSSKAAKSDAVGPLRQHIKSKTTTPRPAPKIVRKALKTPAATGTRHAGEVGEEVMGKHEGWESTSLAHTSRSVQSILIPKSAFESFCHFLFYI